MSARAVAIGLALGLFISGFTYINDAVVRQSWLISHHLPVGVFGLIMVLVLLLNPMLHRLSPRWPLRPAEIALIAALGLASCGWPSYNFFWSLIPNTALPNHWQRTATNWQATGVMSYVPGGSHELAEGFVADWSKLGTRVAGGASPEAGPIDRAIWSGLTAGERREMEEAAARDRIDTSERGTLLRILNRLLSEPDLLHVEVLAGLELPTHAVRLLERREAGQTLGATEAQQLNRAALVAGFDGVILPPPRGPSLLLSGGEATDVVDTLAHGPSAGEWTPLAELPWEPWWPTLRVWSALGLLLAAAALCLGLIVHPQWAHREMLTYPLARFVEEVAQRDAGSALPRIAGNKLFWSGLIFALGLHVINGLGAWFPGLPTIPLDYSLYSLTTLFPNMWEADSNAWHVFRPYLFLTVIAFAFFIPANVSFSVGISYFLFLAVGAFLLPWGIKMGGANVMDADRGAMMRFGAYLGAAMIILYTGRNYYMGLMRGTVGLGRGPDTPTYALVAAYGLLVSTVLAIATLRWAGLDAILSTLFMLMVLLTFLVLTRIVCETGLFFVQSWWLPVSIMTALFGIDAIGPTAFIVLALAGSVLMGDTRTLLMPYLSTALKLTDRQPGGGPGRVAPWLAVMLLVGFAVTGVVTFSLMHNLDEGARGVGNWSYRTVPMMPFNRMAGNLAEMSANQTLADAMLAPAGLRLSAIQFEGHMVIWIVLGLGLLLITAFARLRLAWWPIHPVLFLIWGTMPSARFAVSFLIGWMIKAAVVRSLGAKGHSLVLPLMVGVIAGELLGAVLWIAVGGSYFAITQQLPAVYRIYP